MTFLYGHLFRLQHSGNVYTVKVELCGNGIICKLVNRKGVFCCAPHNVLGQRTDSEYKVITVLQVFKFTKSARVTGPKITFAL